MDANNMYHILVILITAYLSVCGGNKVLLTLEN